MAVVTSGPTTRLVALAILAPVAALGFALSRGSFVEHDGTIRLELTAPIQVTLEGPAVCLESPGFMLASAVNSFEVGADLIGAGVSYSSGQGGAGVGVNAGGYQVSLSTRLTVVARSSDWLDGSVTFDGLHSQTTWIGGVFKGPDAAGTITWRCSGLGRAPEPEGGVGG